MKKMYNILKKKGKLGGMEVGVGVGVGMKEVKERIV
jgi:hypothetical protein